MPWPTSSSSRRDVEMSAIFDSPIFDSASGRRGCRQQDSAKKTVTGGVLLLCLLLAGCASLSKNECLTGDWRTIGYEDGAEGQPRERIGAHQQACAEYGITPDFTIYQQGYDQGLILFCTPRQGFFKAKSGYVYTGICPAELEEGFLQGYDGGREIFLKSGESSRLHRDLQTIAGRIVAIEQQIEETELLLDSGEVPRDQRKLHYREIRTLEEEQFGLRRRYRHLLEETEKVDDRLDFLHRHYRAYQ